LRGGERRLCSVVLVGKRSGPAHEDTLAEGDAMVGLVELRKLALAHRGQAELLADGSIAVSFQGSRIATHQAAQAARCALASRDLVPDRLVALATGRSELSGRLPMGDAIDRASQMLAGASSEDMRAVVVDEVTASLLGPRFPVEEGPRGLLLSTDTR